MSILLVVYNCPAAVHTTEPGINCPLVNVAEPNRSRGFSSYLFDNDPAQAVTNEDDGVVLVL